jgi:hypothetical protein
MLLDMLLDVLLSLLAMTDLRVYELHFVVRER